MAIDPNEKVNKLKALDAVRAQIEKQYGAGAIMTLGDERVSQVDVVPTGSIILDEALGVGGYPRGRIIEMYGPESSGKTTLALHAVAEVQKLGGVAAYIDAEHALDSAYASKLGVNIQELFLSQPDSGEQALEITENLVRSGAIDIIVIDSVAALVPQKEIEGEMGDSVMGVQARLMSQALRKLTASVSKTKTIVIFINQIRMKIGVMFGNPETTTGGNALKFYATIRLDIRRVESIESKSSDDAVGNKIRVKVVKNKVAPPFRKVELEIYFGRGISREASLLDSAVKHDLIEKRGAWFNQGDQKIGQGRESAIAYLEQNKEWTDNLEKELREKLFPNYHPAEGTKEKDSSSSADDTAPQKSVRKSRLKQDKLDKAQAELELDKSVTPAGGE